MTKDEALDLALEALSPWMDTDADHTEQHAAYYAIKQALAAPTVQETPFQIGQRLRQEGKGIFDLWGAVGSDADMPEAQRGFDSAAQPAPTDGWLQEGSLLYRLTDGRKPQNRDEINVTMADESRSVESCTRRAGELLDRIRTTPPAAPKVVDCHATGVCVQSGLRAEMPAPVQPVDSVQAIGNLMFALTKWKATTSKTAPPAWRKLLQACADMVATERTAPVPLTDDTRRLDALAKNSWDLRCFDMSDDDIGWQVIEHHMQRPHERKLAEVFRDDPRQAIDAAIEAAHGITKGGAA
jgi:hypothetical protein